MGRCIPHLQRTPHTASYWSDASIETSQIQIRFRFAVADMDANAEYICNDLYCTKGLLINGMICFWQILHLFQYIYAEK